LTRDWRESNPPTAGVAAKEVKHRLDARRDRHGAKSKSKFKEPVRPDLTHWRLNVPESWSVESVSAFSECLDHVRVPVTKDKRATAERLYPYFGANGQVDMVDDFLFDDELVMVTEDETFYGRVKPIAYRFSGRCWVNNHAHVLLAGDRVRADYLCFSLMHYDVQPWLTGTTGRAKLTQGALNALPLAVPPQAEMVEIVRRVNSMFALADRIEARCIAARAQAQRLTPLVLAKAFRGELVPQDPNDEPASTLLARIASSDTVAAGKNKRKVPVALKELA
jgi:type I restriction enzyme, S subunit